MGAEYAILDKIGRRKHTSYFFLYDTHDREKKDGISKLFQPSNPGDIVIKVFVYTLGEVFKRLLEPRNGAKVNLSSVKTQKSLADVQEWLRNGFITIVRLEDVSSDFFRYYR